MNTGQAEAHSMPSTQSMSTTMSANSCLGVGHLNFVLFYFPHTGHTNTPLQE